MFIEIAAKILEIVVACFFFFLTCLLPLGIIGLVFMTVIGFINNALTGG